MVRKHPFLDEDFPATLALRAEELDTHPLALLDVDLCDFWSKYAVGNAHLVNAKASAAFFSAQRADPYRNGVLDGMMYGAMFALADVGRVLQNALLFKPVRKGAAHDLAAFCSYVNTTGEVNVNGQSFEIIKADVARWL
jgi:hypothetical protein